MSLYSKEEMVLLSILYARVKKQRYTVPLLNPKALFEMFKQSLALELSMFDRKNIDKIARSTNKSLREKNNEELTKEVLRIKMFFSNLNYVNDLDLAINEINLAKKYNINIITYLDNEYPNNLKKISVPPFVLYIKGQIPSEEKLQNSLAIIGSRNTDEKYGKKVAFNIGNLVKENDWYNISGLALGCDEYGHKGSLGATGAIVGQGLALPIYPKENKELSEEMIKNNGFILSELPPSTRINPVALIARDRLQSGISNAIVVIQCSKKSGTLYTVKNALEQNKKIFVIDYSFDKNIIKSYNVSGNNELLKKNCSLISNVKITKEEKERIIGIRNKEELIFYLKDH